MSQQLSIRKDSNSEADAVWWKPIFSLQRELNNQFREAVSNIFQPSFMTPSLWDAQEEAFDVLQRNAHRMCCGLFNQRQMATPWLMGSVTEPYVDIIENDKTIKLKADVPGLDAKDLEVSVANNSVTIKGTRKDERKEEDETYVRHECRVGEFSRTIALPEEADTNNASVVFDKNVLTISIPKKEGAKIESPHFKFDINTGAKEQPKAQHQEEAKHKSKVA